MSKPYFYIVDGKKICPDLCACVKACEDKLGKTITIAVCDTDDKCWCSKKKESNKEYQDIKDKASLTPLKE